MWISLQTWPSKKSKAQKRRTHSLNDNEQACSSCFLPCSFCLSMKFKFSPLQQRLSLNISLWQTDRLLVCLLNSYVKISDVKACEAWRETSNYLDKLCECTKDSGLFCSGRAAATKDLKEAQTVESIVSIQVVMSTWSHTPMQSHTHALIDLQARVNLYVGAIGWALIEINDELVAAAAKYKTFS